MPEDQTYDSFSFHFLHMEPILETGVQIVFTCVLVCFGLTGNIFECTLIKKNNIPYGSSFPNVMLQPPGESEHLAADLCRHASHVTAQYPSCNLFAVVHLKVDV